MLFIKWGNISFNLWGQQPNTGSQDQLLKKSQPWSCGCYPAGSATLIHLVIFWSVLSIINYQHSHMLIMNLTITIFSDGLLTHFQTFLHSCGHPHTPAKVKAGPRLHTQTHLHYHTNHTCTLIISQQRWKSSFLTHKAGCSDDFVTVWLRQTMRSVKIGPKCRWNKACKQT